MTFVGTATIELTRLVEVNEAAKSLRHRSWQVNLLALNAMVKSRRAGSELPAFSEAAAQMRGWSTELCSTIDRLAIASAEGVALVSQLLERERIRHILVDTAQRVPQEPSVTVALRHAEATTLRIGEQLTRVRTTTRKLLHELSRSGLMACVLGRSAMIEAARVPGEAELGLSQVAREFSESGAAALEVIKALGRQTEKTRTT